MMPTGCRFDETNWYVPLLFASPSACRGFEYAKFMPKKTTVPVEIELLLRHICAILGSAQVAIGVLCVMAAMSKSKEAKKIALSTTVFYFAVVTGMQFYKPAGTGADGSPATGPLPVIVGLSVPSIMALVM